MWYTNSRVESLVLRRKARDFFFDRDKLIGMLKRGVKFTPTQQDAMAILEKLGQNKLSLSCAAINITNFDLGSCL